MKNHRNVDLTYILKLMETRSATGYFACGPDPEPDVSQGLAFLETHPCDAFMRQHLMQVIGNWETDRLAHEIRCTSPSDHIRMTFYYELCRLNDRFENLLELFNPETLSGMAAESPLIYLRALDDPDHAIHEVWSERVRRNLALHQPMDPPDRADVPLPYSGPGSKTGELKPVSIESLATAARGTGSNDPVRARPPAETARVALEKLDTLGILADVEKRHVASLSPIGLLRQWHLDLKVECGRHHYRLQGIQTAYGRGFDLDVARASYAMEIVERCSSFTGVEKDCLTGYQLPHRIEKESFSGMCRKDMPTLDPNDLHLEAPYRDAPIYWMQAERWAGNQDERIWIPVQSVFLFCNLDEPKLFSGRGSTGLAAGNTMAEAKVAALTEIIERYSEAVMPFRPDQCFEVESRDPQFAALLQNYADHGIRIQFQDLTTPLGIPCCKCFVHQVDGGIAKGAGANLNARRALLSALTETPFPYPGGGVSAAGMSGLIRVPFENLPDFSSGNPETDLTLLEKLLAVNGYHPLYVDLTRSNIGLPVVRALVPGMDINGDLDRFTRVHPDFFKQYRAMFNMPVSS